MVIYSYLIRAYAGYAVPENFKRYLRNNPVDLIITTGPPHSVHLIGRSLKKIFTNLPWIADFRDPWTSVYYYKDLQTGKIADALHHRMEKSIIEKADMVLVVSNRMKQEYQSFKHRSIEVILMDLMKRIFKKQKLQTTQILIS